MSGYRRPQSPKPLFPAYGKVQPSSSYDNRESFVHSSPEPFRPLHSYDFDRYRLESRVENSNRSFPFGYTRQQLHSSPINHRLRLDDYGPEGYPDEIASLSSCNLSRGIISKDYGHQSFDNLKYSKQSFSSDYGSPGSKVRDFQRNFNTYKNSNVSLDIPYERNASSEYQLHKDEQRMPEDSHSNKFNTHHEYPFNEILANTSTFSALSENKSSKPGFDIPSCNIPDFIFQKNFFLDSTKSACIEKDSRQNKRIFNDIDELHNLLKLNNKFPFVQENTQMSHAHPKESLHGEIKNLENISCSAEQDLLNSQQKVLEDRIVTMMSEMAQKKVLEEKVLEAENKSPSKIESLKSKNISGFIPKYKEFTSQENAFSPSLNESYPSVSNKIELCNYGNFDKLDKRFLPVFDSKENHPSSLHSPVFKAENPKLLKPNKHDTKLVDTSHNEMKHFISEFSPSITTSSVCVSDKNDESSVLSIECMESCSQVMKSSDFKQVYSISNYLDKTTEKNVSVVPTNTSNVLVEREFSNSSVSSKNSFGDVLTNISDITLKSESSKFSSIPFLCESAHDEVKKTFGLSQELNVDQECLPASNGNDESLKNKSYLEDAINVLAEKEPIVGLEFIIEYQNLVSMKGSFPFFCKLCNSSIVRMSALDHVTGSKHRLKYLKLKDQSLYKVILSMKGQNKEKEDKIREVSKTLENIYGRGRVRVEVKDLKKMPETPFEETTIDKPKTVIESSILSTGLPIQVMETESSFDSSSSNSRCNQLEKNLEVQMKDSSITSTTDCESFKTSNVKSPMLKRSASFDNKVNKILKTEKEMTNSSFETAKIKSEAFSKNSNCVSQLSETTLGTNSSVQYAKSSIDDSDTSSSKEKDSENIHFPELLDYVSKYDISTEEEAELLMQTVGAMLKTLLRFKLKNFINNDTKHLMDSFSNPSPESFEQLISILKRSSISQEEEFNQNIPDNNLCSLKTVADEVVNESECKPKSINETNNNTSNEIHIKTTGKEGNKSNTCETTNAPQSTSTSVPVSQNSTYVNLVPPPFFSWPNANNVSSSNTATIIPPTTMQSNLNWNPSFQMMPMPGLPFFLQPGVGLQTYSNTAQFPSYVIPVSQFNSPGPNQINFPTSTSILPPPLPPPTTQYSTSDEPSLNTLPPPPPPLPPLLPPPPPFPTP